MALVCPNKPLGACDQEAVGPTVRFYPALRAARDPWGRGLIRWTIAACPCGARWIVSTWRSWEGRRKS